MFLSILLLMAGVLHVGAHTVNIDASLARGLDNGVLNQPARGLHHLSWNTV